MHRLDADAYSSEEVVVLAVPISLPYPVYDAGYERADGEVEHKGEFYRLVKQKVENDTLFMVCIRDQNQKHIARTMNEYTQLANDLPSSAKNTMDLLSKLFKDFTATSFVAPALGLTLAYDIAFSAEDVTILQRGLPVDSPPPELS